MEITPATENTSNATQARAGQTVTVHYRGTLRNGDEFDNSRIRGKALTFELGSGRMIPGFSNGILGMSVGDMKDIHIPMGEAYGPRVEEAVQPVPKTSFGEGFEFIQGGLVQGKGPRGPFVARVMQINSDHVVLDFNHPLAGEDLTFEVELLSVEEGEAETVPTLASWNKSMKKAELIEVATSRGITLNSKATKAKIIEALEFQDSTATYG